MAAKIKKHHFQKESHSHDGIIDKGKSSCGTNAWMDRNCNAHFGWIDAVLLAAKENDKLISGFSVIQSNSVRRNNFNLSLKEFSGMIINMVLDYRRKAVEHDHILLLLPLADQIVIEFRTGYNTFCYQG